MWYDVTYNWNGNQRTISIWSKNGDQEPAENEFKRYYLYNEIISFKKR